MTASMIASLSFIALAIWGWGVAVDDVLTFLLMLVCLLVFVILMAATFTGLLVFAKKCFRKESSSL